MISESELKQYKEWGLHLVPLLDDTKKPKYKTIRVKQKGNGKFKTEFPWKKDPNTGEYITWSDEELLESKRVGINHEACSLIDVDCDTIEGSPFMSELPATLTIGKKVDGKVVVSKKLYFVEGFIKHKQYKHNDEVIIEQLAHTQSWCFGDNRIILNDVKPTTLDQAQINNLVSTIKKINAWAVMTRLMPKQGTRDQFYLTLAGTLARETDWAIEESESFIEVLADHHGEDVKKVLEKVKRQYNNLEENKDVWGVKHLAELLHVKSLKCIDELRPAQENNKQLVTLKLGEFLVKPYPPTEYLQYPISGKGKLVQVWANAGHGKTWFCLEWACAIANGQDFLKWKYPEGKKPEPYPVLYVEGEMSVSELQDRLLSISQRYIDQEKEFNRDNFYIAPLREQPEQTFESLTDKAGRSNVENTAKRIFKETGKKPFIFLDNITALTVMQEKEGADWVELVHWLNSLRAQDYGVIFLHHGTKAGDTSSGSNLKERSIDISIHLSVPEDKELLDLDDEKNTQIKIKFDKWREFLFTKHSKPFIAVLNRDKTTWTFDQLLTEKQRKVKELHDEGLKPLDIVKKLKKEVGQAQVYRILKIFKQEVNEKSS